MSLRQTWQQQRQQRQQEVIQRQHQVQEQLAALRHTRQVQSVQLHQNLQVFQQQLQQETQEFLSICAADRVLMSQQLSRELSDFRLHLSQSVALLRQQIQSHIQQLQAEVQNRLQSYQQERLQNQLELIQNLANYVENLRAEVQAQLIEFGIVRQVEVQQLRQMLQQDGERRRAEVVILFQELSEFRAELRGYCDNLRQLVWGDAVTLSAVTAPEPEEIDPLATILKESAAPTAPELTEATGASPIARVIQPKVIQAALTSSIVQKPSPAGTESLTPTSEPPTPSLEELVYTYLHDSQGAHLADIESALGINRFQTVDTLRALIRKGLVTQCDRMYLIQEVNL